MSRDSPLDDFPLWDGRHRGLEDARMRREHGELMAALKALAHACESAEQSIALEYGKPFEDPDFVPSGALANARALIARIEEP
jgi:hypothetical protein